MSLEHLTIESFAGRVGERFRIRLPPTLTLDTTLVEARPLGPAPKDLTGRTKRAPFALLFRGPGEPLLPQRIYTVEHDAMGALDIFMVPVGRERDALLYEAIFNYVRRRAVRSPFEEQVDLAVLEQAEAEPLVETERGIEALDVDTKRLAGSRRLPLQIANQRRADAVAAVGRQQCDVDDPDFFGRSINVQAAGGPAVARNHVVRGVGKPLPVVVVLRAELHVHERRLLGLGPVDQGQFLDSCAGVDVPQKGLVSRFRRAQCKPMSHTPRRTRIACPIRTSWRTPMSTSRRHLIKMGMCATAALTVSFDALFPDDALASPAYDSPPVDDGFVVRRDMFEACIGHYVRVAYGPRIRPAVRSSRSRISRAHARRKRSAIRMGSRSF